MSQVNDERSKKRKTERVSACDFCKRRRVRCLMLDVSIRPHWLSLYGAYSRRGSRKPSNVRCARQTTDCAHLPKKRLQRRRRFPLLLALLLPARVLLSCPRSHFLHSHRVVRYQRSCPACPIPQKTSRWSVTAAQLKQKELQPIFEKVNPQVRNLLLNPSRLDQTLARGILMRSTGSKRCRPTRSHSWTPPGRSFSEASSLMRPTSYAFTCPSSGLSSQRLTWPRWASSYGTIWPDATTCRPKSQLLRSWPLPSFQAQSQ
jgi:hypothetical protein